MWSIVEKSEAGLGAFDHIARHGKSKGVLFVSYGPCLGVDLAIQEEDDD